jgi:exopolyphosphatase/guanosine-5'-triphosphate,3'-diphosphate pyrophosphatase
MASGTPAGVIDVGSNTVRLLVARLDDTGPVRICSERVRLGLGAELEKLGRVSDRKLAEATDAVRSLSALAAAHCPDAPVILVTAPGRQAENARELIAALERGARGPVRVLSATEEATLSFHGAVAGARQSAWPVAVVDLGGASTEIAVGRPADGPGWIRSVDLGALRLTTRLLPSEQPAQSRLEAAHAAAAAVFESIEPPRAFEALAVGGCARALRKIVGATLGPEELAEARELLATTTHAELVRRHGVHLSRAPLLLAAVLILTEVQQRLGVPLQVADGGLREGALLASRAAIAA